MSIQNSLIVRTDDAYVVRPKSNADWQLFRRNQSPGAGTYHAMNKDGIVENLGGPAIPPQLFANALFVDAIFGNNTSAVPHSLMDSTNNTSAHKYQTIAAAMAIAGVGDVIIVYPGTYNENVNLYKDGVTYYYYAGTDVTCYWHNETADTVCKVFGYGTFRAGDIFTASANSLIQIKDGYIYLEHYDLFNNNSDTLGPTYVIELGSIFTPNNLSPVIITKGRNVISEDHTCVALYACGINAYLSVNFDTMQHFTNSVSNEIIVSLGGNGTSTNFQGNAYINGKRIINSPNYGAAGGSMMEISNRNTGSRGSINIEADLYDISTVTTASRFLIDYTFNENTDFIFKGNVYSPNHSFVRISDSSTPTATFRHEGIVTVGDKIILQTFNASALPSHSTIYLDGQYNSISTVNAILISGFGTQVPIIYFNGSLYNLAGIGINRTFAGADIIFDTFKIITNGGDSINFTPAGTYRVIHSLATTFPPINATNSIIGSIDYSDIGVT